jgi:hypothetical protein
MLDISTGILIWKITISETARASENCIASGCIIIDGKEEMPYLSSLRDTIFFYFSISRESADFTT